MSIVFSPAPKPISPPKPPKTKVRERNTERAGESFKRCYHSRARQKWVNMQQCAACGVWGHSENAHVLGNDGARRKGHFTTIAPLCGPRYEADGSIYGGCHNLYDEHQEQFRARFPSFNPKRATRTTEKKWREFCATANHQGAR